MARTALLPLMLACLAVAGPASADPDTWTVAAIRYEGNAITREEVLARELPFTVGDIVDRDTLLRGHQSIVDLALFREVDVSHEPDGDQTVVTVRVREKRYLLPVPRIGGNSNGGHSYGLQLRWNNVAGLNHTLDARVVSGERDDRIADREESARVSYDAPYLINDTWGLATGFEHTRRDAVGPAGIFDERLDQFDLLFMQDLRIDRPRTGWILGYGVQWERQRTAGALAPAANGDSTALVFTAAHSDLRFHLYSETGSVFGGHVVLAQDGFLSDRSFIRAEAGYRRHIALDGGPHRNLNVVAAAGWSNGVSDWRNTYSIGGSTRLRGYDLDFLEGASYVYGAVEWLRPVRYDWLRLLAVVEAGATAGSVNAARDGGPYASIGLGFRIRLPWFVGVELEAGVAQPLHGGDGLRFFAGGRR